MKTITNSVQKIANNAKPDKFSAIKISGAVSTNSSLSIEMDIFVKSEYVIDTTLNLYEDYVFIYHVNNFVNIGDDYPNGILYNVVESYLEKLSKALFRASNHAYIIYNLNFNIT